MGDDGDIGSKKLFFAGASCLQPRLAHRSRAPSVNFACADDSTKIPPPKDRQNVIPGPFCRARETKHNATAKDPPPGRRMPRCRTDGALWSW